MAYSLMKKIYIRLISKSDAEPSCTRAQQSREFPCRQESYLLKLLVKKIFMFDLKRKYKQMYKTYQNKAK